jgi:hypothetical protein
MISIRLKFGVNKYIVFYQKLQVNMEKNIDLTQLKKVDWFYFLSETSMIVRLSSYLNNLTFR